MAPLVGTETTVLCLQNGIDSYQVVADAFGGDLVLPGASYIEAGMPSPGVVKQTGDVVRIVFGELDGNESVRGRQIQEIMTRAGISAQLSADVYTALWSKFLFISTMAGVTSLARQTLAELMPRPEWRRVVLECLREIEAVGRASGVNFPDAIHKQTVQYIESNLADLHASMHSDVMRGRPLELEALNGAAARAGRTVGVATPINDVIYAMLKPLATGVC